MVIPFLKVPFLAQAVIVGQMPLVDAFVLSTTSLKGNRIVKCSLTKKQVQMSIGDSIVLYRAPEDWFLFNLRDRKQMTLQNQYHLWKITNDIETSVKEEQSWCGERKFITYWADKTRGFQQMVEYFLNMYQRSSICLAFDPKETEKFTYFMQMGIKERIEEVMVCSSWDDHDDFVKRVLEECRNVQKVKIDCKTTPKFAINHNTTLPFHFESIILANANWISQDHFKNLFLNCKQVVLNETIYNDADIQSICQKWMEGCDLEYLEVHGNSFFPQETMEQSVGLLRDAVSVTRVKLYGMEPKDDRVLFPDPGVCYKITQQPTGKEAIVVLDPANVFFLTTRFETEPEKIDEEEDEDETDSDNEYENGDDN